MNLQLYTLDNKFIKNTKYFPNNGNFSGIIVYDSGTKFYLLNGKYHRFDGPAIMYSNGNKEYWVCGKKHRLDGPAIMYSNGNKEYFINGTDCGSKEQYHLLVDMMKLKGLL